MMKEIIAKNCRLYREEKDLTQKELADKCQFSQPFLSGIEKAKRLPNINTLEIIAKALEVETYLLLVPHKYEPKL